MKPLQNPAAANAGLSFGNDLAIESLPGDSSYRSPAKCWSTPSPGP